MGDQGGEDVDVEVLQGGVANVGAVVRIGDEVQRPANERSALLHATLTAVRSAGFDAVPEPLALTEAHERLRFVPGDVPVTPFPAWAQTDDVLTSTVELIAGLHRATATLDLPSTGWAPDMADPEGGPVLCHNDVCLENVVFRAGRAVALLDLDFAAPGRPTWDLAAWAGMCVPIDDDLSAERNGWLPADRPARLRLASDTYGLDEHGRQELLALTDRRIERGGRWVERQAATGHPGFVALWEAMGGRERYDRRRRWWAQARPAFERSLA